MKKSFSIIAAVDSDSGIGKKGTLPWRLPADLKHFKDITTATSGADKQNAVIMGRKTWESLPEKFRPLPQRLNIVLTRDVSRQFPDGVIKAQSLEGALRLLEESPWAEKIENTFVIGGADVFRQALAHPRCQKIFLTQILARYACDVFFPDFRNQFQQTTVSPHHEENSVEYYFAEYHRL